MNALERKSFKIIFCMENILKAFIFIERPFKEIYLLQTNIYIYFIMYLFYLFCKAFNKSERFEKIVNENYKLYGEYFKSVHFY